MSHSKPRFFVKGDTLFMNGKPLDVARSIILICLVADGYPDLPEIPIREGTARRMLRLKRAQTFLQMLEEDDVCLGTIYEEVKEGWPDPLKGNGQPPHSRQKPENN